MSITTLLVCCPMTLARTTSWDRRRSTFLKSHLTSIYPFSSLFIFLSFLICLRPLYPFAFSKNSPPPLPLPPVPFPISSVSCPLAAAAGGDMTARRATATGGTNTRRARGARKAKRPARTTMQTKRTRMPWHRDHRHLSVCLSGIWWGESWCRHVCFLSFH